jgi:hypothetical protein
MRSNYFTTSSRIHLSWLLSMLVLSTTLWSVVADEDVDFDPGSDFGGYVEEMERREQAERMYEAKLNAHEVWRQTTWTGSCVRKLQDIGKHFKPFVVAISDALEEDGSTNSPTQVLMYLGIRMFMVVGVLFSMYVGAKIMQLFLGGNYEIIEEVIIVHEHETEEEAAKARASTTRGKKTKQKAS